MPKQLYVYFYILVFVIIMLLTYILDLSKIKKRKYKSISEVQYLIAKFNLNSSKINYKKICLVVSLLNAIIITTVVVVVSSLNAPIALQFLVGFILLFALIYMLYEIFGRILITKGYQKKTEKKKGSKK